MTIKNHIFTSGLFLTLVTLALLFESSSAFATPVVDLQSQASHVSKQLVNIPKLIAMGSYVVGVFMAVQALLALRRYTENPAEHPLVRALGLAAVSALLIVLPYIVHVFRNSLQAENETVLSSSGSFTDKF